MKADGISSTALPLRVERLDQTATLTPTQALAEAAKLNRRAADLIRMGEEDPTLDLALGHAAQLAQVALSLTAYAVATGRWQGR